MSKGHDCARADECVFDRDCEVYPTCVMLDQMSTMDDAPELKRDVPTNVFLRMIHEANHSSAVLETDAESDAP